jgi:hypothetical protein
MVVGLGLSVPPPEQAIAAIEVVIEPAPISPASQPGSAADLNGGPGDGSDSRPRADEERQKKGMPDARTLEGEGTAKVATLAPRDGAEKREGEDLRSDPEKEAVRIVPPLTSDRPRPQEARPAAPGTEGAAWAPEGVRQDDKETTAKRQPIQCGANAQHKVLTQAVLRRGQVQRELTERDKARSRDIGETRSDLHISPGYQEFRTVGVFTDGGKRAAVALPQGMSVRIGDRLEFQVAHLDPARPCHFIPNVAVRVVAGPPAWPGVGAPSYPPIFGLSPPASGSAR